MKYCMLPVCCMMQAATLRVAYQVQGSPLQPLPVCDRRAFF